MNEPREKEYVPTLAERMAGAIPTPLTATPHVGIGGARRQEIVGHILPIVLAEIEAARAGERAKLSDAPKCTCGAPHAITCLTVAAAQPHTMVNDAGEVFYPDGPGDALWFATNHGARFLNEPAARAELGLNPIGDAHE